MTKIFKNSKQVLSFVIAFAIIAVSLFTGVIINADASCATTNVVHYSGTAATSFSDTVHSGSTEEDAIVINTAEELAYLANGANGTTNGKFYKLSDKIDAIVLQPQDKVNAILALDSADSVKDYFVTNKSQLKKWVTAATTSSNFGGTLDGNGVIIYGMYSEYNNGSVGLFPRAGVFTVKNLGVKNCYIYGDQAAVFSSNGNEQGTSVFEKCMLANNFVLCNRLNDGAANAGLFVGSNTGGGTYSGVSVTVNNCLVYGNSVRHTEYSVDYKGDKYHEQPYDMSYGLWGNASAQIGATVTNSVILDTVPYAISYASTAFHKSTITNVYTNMLDTEIKNVDWKSDGTVKIENNTLAKMKEDGSVYMEFRQYVGGAINANTNSFNRTFAAGSFYKVDANASIRVDALDENVWFVTEEIPQLRLFHNLSAVEPSAEGHGYKCADCNIDAVVAHTWDGNECTECGYTCNHTSQTVDDTKPATCVSKETVYSTCNNCKQVLIEQVGVEPTGHDVTYVEPNPADCVNTGVYGYWHCSICDGNYVAETEEEAKWAPMDSSYANPETDLIIPADPIGGHLQKTDADGVIVIVDGANGHYYECSVCDGKLNHKSELLKEGEVVSHDFSASVCKECGWKCEEHDYQLTGNILVVGDCYTDHEDELECTICGKKESKVTKASHNIVPVEEVKATDKMEGTKAHYQCTECKSIYADAEGKTSITKASLVIAKKLPAGYENTYEGTGGATAPENADTSNKSPSTADSVMTVVAAVTVLVGAAYAVVRKVVKA